MATQEIVSMSIMACLHNLPEEVLVHAAQFLSVQTLLQFERCNPYLYEVISRNLEKLKSLIDDIELIVIDEGDGYSIRLFRNSKAADSPQTTLSVASCSISETTRSFQVLNRNHDCDGFLEDDRNLANFGRALFRHFRPHDTAVALSVKLFAKVAVSFPSSIQEVTYFPQLTEGSLPSFSRSLEHLKSLKSLCLLWGNCLSSAFLQHPTIQNLRTLKISAGIDLEKFSPGSLCFTDKIVLGSAWTTLDISNQSPIELTEDGLVELLQQWAENKRDIKKFHFRARFYSDAEAVVTRIPMRFEYVDKNRYLLFRSDGGALSISSKAHIRYTNVRSEFDTVEFDIVTKDLDLS